MSGVVSTLLMSSQYPPCVMVSGTAGMVKMKAMRMRAVTLIAQVSMTSVNAFTEVEKQHILFHMKSVFHTEVFILCCIFSHSWINIAEDEILL